MIRKISVLSLVMLFAIPVAVAHAADLPPIKVVKDAKPGATIFKAASRQKPLEIHSAKEAAAHFSGDALASLKKQVDFKKQVVLTFAWKGSGQDKLSYDILESFPEQVVFKYKRGLTKDLRPHVHTFVLRANVKWRVAQ